jgi:hypothetical protein
MPDDAGCVDESEDGDELGVPDERESDDCDENPLHASTTQDAKDFTR